jgi:hypothetical protein
VIARRIAALLLAAATLAGCLDTPVASAVPTPSRAPEPTPRTTAYELGQTIWYEGLLVHVDRAVATLDERGGPVEVLLRVENPSSEPAELNAPIRLLIDEAPVEPTRDSRVPTVPANGFVGVVMTYELQEIASVDGAAVQVGEDPQHLALVPLLAATGDPILFEPVTLDVSGAATAADLRIRLRGGVLRWDLPDWSQELVAGLQALTLTYDVTYTGDFAGGFAFTRESVALRLPDGSIVGPRRDGHSQSVELIGAKKTKTGLFSRFEIPTGTTGQLRLLVRNGTTERAIPFTIG